MVSAYAIPGGKLERPRCEPLFAYPQYRAWSGLTQGPMHLKASGFWPVGCKALQLKELWGGIQFDWGRDPVSQWGKTSEFLLANVESGFMSVLNLLLPTKVSDHSRVSHYLLQAHRHCSLG